MSQDNEDPILRKIRKCLALAASSVPGEAEAAMRQAQKLMALHNVDTGTLARAALGQAQVQGTRGARPAIWENTLVWACCNAFGARPLWSSGPKGGWKDEHNGWWTFIAPKGKVELVVYAYTVLVRQLLKERAKFVAERAQGFTRVQRAADADAFCEAYASRLYNKIIDTELSPQEREALEAEAKARSNPDGKKVVSTNNGQGSLSAAIEGAMAGDKASFYKAARGKAELAALGHDDTEAS